MATTLGDICKVDWGNTAITKKSYVEDGEFLAVSATGGDGKLNHYEHEADVCVLSAIGAQCGKMFFPQQRFTAIKNTITLTPKADKVFSKFLYYLFTAIELPKRGAAQPFISKGDIQNFDVPFLPPLAEQQRIVAKLDAAFADIDTAIEVAEAKEKEVQKLKISLLSSSLSEDAVTWNTVKLGDVCELIYGKALDKKDRVENGIIPAYGANGIKAFANKPLYDKPSIIIGRKGSAGELNKVVEPFWALDVTYYVTTDESIIDLDFLFYALTTLNLPSMAKGVKPGINRNDVYDKSITLPPLAEQQRIVAKLDAAYNELKNANESIIKSKANYLALKSALLAQELQSEAA